MVIGPYIGEGGGLGGNGGQFNRRQDEFERLVEPPGGEVHQADRKHGTEISE